MFVRAEIECLLKKACSAIGVCCVMDLRYGGRDESIIRRLGNDPIASDYVIRDGELVLVLDAKGGER